MTDFCPTNPFTILKQIRELVPISDSHAEYVCDLYMNGKRHYHNISHLATMWGIHKQLETDEFLDDTLIASAIFYHDAWYDPLFNHDNQNEKWSSHLWQQHCLSEQYRQPVSNLIESTIDHFADRLIENSLDVHREWFIGLDLASLAAPWETFVEHGRAIELEFSHLSLSDWKKGRDKFMKKVSQTVPLFKHPTLRKHFQEAAYQNVKRLLNG